MGELIAATTSGGVSADVFRSAMRLLPSGVAIISAGRDREVAGLTASSFVSVSVEPATVSVCVNRKASAWPLIEKRGVFGVSVLAADQFDLAERFSGRAGISGVERFETTQWGTLVSGVPILCDAVAAFDCEVEHLITRDSHTIVIGQVLDLYVSSGCGALAYWDGEYVAIERDEVGRRWADVSLPQRNVHLNRIGIAR